MGWTIISLLVMNSDKILLGYFSGPVLVTKYVITKYLVNIVEGIVWNVVHEVIPGFGKLYGSGDYEKLKKIRAQVLLLTWAIAVSIGASIIMFNDVFLALWVGKEYFAGNVENILIVIMVFQIIIIRCDSAIIDTTLDISKKVYIGLASVILSFIVVVYLTPLHGIIGLDRKSTRLNSSHVA